MPPVPQGNKLSIMRLLVLACCALVSGAVEYYPVYFDGQYQKPDWVNKDPATCICNLHTVVCDPNCYCDPDCSEGEKALFSARKAETLSNVSRLVPQCDDPTLAPIRYPKDGWGSNLVNRQLCVVVDNNIGRGAFHPFPTTAAVKARMDAGVGDTYSFQGSTGVASGSGVLPTSGGGHSSSTYRVGDLLWSKRTYPAALGAAAVTETGFMRLPGPGWGGACSDQHRVGFWQDISAPRSCSQRTASLEALCGAGAGSDNRFAAAPYVWGLAVAGGKHKHANGSDTGAQLAWVEAKAVDITSDSDSSTTITAQPAEPSYSAGACSNVLTSLRYVIVLAPSTATVAGVTAYYTLGTVTDAQALRLDLITSVKFVVEENLDSEALASSSAKSGNPGYIQGLPILFGKRVPGADANTKAVAVSKSGLVTLGSAPGGLCSSSSSSSSSGSSSGDGGYSFASQSRSLLFGEESLGGCAVRLTKAQFATECTQPNQLRALMNTTVLGANRIGRFGNSNSTNPDDWVPIIVDSASWTLPADGSVAAFPSAGVLDSTGTVCSGMVTSMNWHFVTAQVGSEYNLQSQIVGVKVSFPLTSWEFTANDTVATSSGRPVAATQDFPVISTVSFSKLPLDNSLTPHVLTRKPLLPPLPPDIFYPIMPSSSGSKTVSASAVASLLLVTGLAVLCPALIWR